MVVSLSLLADAAAALRPDVPTDPIVVGTSTPPHRSRKQAITFAEGVIIYQSKRQFFSPTTSAAAPTESIGYDVVVLTFPRRLDRWERRGVTRRRRPQGGRGRLP